MSEPRWLKGVRGGTRERIPEPKKKRLVCPVCGGYTVSRDVSSEDGYYVEWCLGGVIKVTGDEANEVVEFDCPYWNAGWER
jgi:hypothetical protein